VRSDEAWHHHEGAPLELLVASPTAARSRACGSDPADDGAADARRAAGWWQAARPLATTRSASCAVAPGFEWGDFTLLAELPESERPVLEPEHLMRSCE
jgi:predicted cupin superfamily sugar epimerase